MPFVYRYLDSMCEPKYVGISRNRKTLDRRVESHKRDDWYKTEERWVIEVAEYLTECDVQMLEGHLIALYTDYGYELYNVAKTKWGRCSMIPSDYEPEWEKYIGNISEEMNPYTLQDILSRQPMSEADLKHNIKNFRRSIAGLEDCYDALYAVAKKLSKYKRVFELESFNGFKKELLNMDNKLQSEDLYSSYLDYCKRENREFEMDENDFNEALNRAFWFAEERRLNGTKL